MRALVAGANGFIGSHIVKLLIKNGYKVRGIVRKTSNLDSLKGLPVDLYYADLATHPSFDDAMHDVDLVFNAAGAFRVEGVPKKYFFDVNFKGIGKLLDAAKKKGVSRFVHCSSIGVLGDIKKIPANEDFPYDPADHYQESKVAGEKLALKYYKDGLPVTVIRPTSTYGPGDTRYLKMYRFINNNKFRMIGNGNVFHHLVYVDDLAEGILMAAKKDEAIGEIITIGGEKYITINEYVKTIAEALDKPVPDKISIPVFPVWFAGLMCEIICKPFGLNPPIYRRRVGFFARNRAFDISKAKRILGYQPKIDINEGIKKTVAWYKEMGMLIILYFCYLNGFLLLFFRR